MKFPSSIFHNIVSKQIVLVSVLLGFFLVNVQAETVYITNSLFIGLHKERSIDSKILKVLPTGAALKVIKRDGDFVNVRDTEGVSGWINDRYVIAHDPKNNTSLDENSAQSRIKELEAELQKIKTQQQKYDLQLITSSKETNSLKDGNKKLTNSAKQLTEINAQTKDKITSLQKINKANEFDTDSYKLPNSVIFSVIALLLGFLIGIIFVGWRRNRRYGGLKL